MLSSSTSLLTAAAALAAVLGLIWLAARGARFAGLASRSASSGRLLAVRDSVALDARRRLHLVRCADRHVLLLTGGGKDLLVGWVELAGDSAAISGNGWPSPIVGDRNAGDENMPTVARFGHAPGSLSWSARVGRLCCFGFVYLRARFALSDVSASSDRALVSLFKSAIHAFRRFRFKRSRSGETWMSPGHAPLGHAPLGHAPLGHAPLGHAPLGHAGEGRARP